MEHSLQDSITSAFSARQRTALAGRKADQDRTIDALGRLSAAMVAPASGREAVWRRNVADALEELDSAIEAEAAAAARADSLMSDVARTQRRLRNRVRRLRVDDERLRHRIRQAHEAVVTDEVGVARVRAEISDLTTAVQLVRARESDLIYEAYFDAFNRDIEDELTGPVRRPDDGT